MTSEEHYVVKKRVKRKPSKFDERRIVFCQRLVARGFYDPEIAEQARESDYFIRRTQDGQVIRPTRHMATCTINRYIRKARKQLKDGWTGNAEAEIRNGHVRMLEVFRMAAEDRDLKAMVAAQRAINDMFGLKKNDMAERFDAAVVAMQMREMQEATTGGAHEST